MAIATLTIDLVAGLAKLQEGMDKAGRLAEKNAAEIQARYEASANALKTAGAGIAAALSVGAIKEFFANLSASALAVKDLAEATGSTIPKISALQDVAQRTGTQFESVTAGLVKFNDSLKNAKKDSPVALALQQIGLNAEALRVLDPADALLEVSKALSGFADDGNRARLVQELFGRSVKEVAPFLRELADAGKLNATLTEDQVLAYDKFNKELLRLQANSLDTARAVGGPLVVSINELFGVLRGEGPGLLNEKLAVPLQAISVFAANVGFVLKGVGTEIGVIAAKAEAIAKLDYRAFFTVREAADREAKEARKEFDALERRLLQLGSVPQADYSNEGRNASIVKALPKIKPLVDPKDTAELNKANTAYKALAATVGLQLVQQSELIAGGDKLSAAQQLRIKVLTALNNGETAFTAAQRNSLLAALDGADVLEKQTSLLETQAKVREFSAKVQEQQVSAQLREVQARIQDNESLRELAAEYGKTAEQVEALRVARLQSLLVAEQAQLVNLKNTEGSDEEAAALARNIELLQQQIALRQNLASIVDNAASSPLAGAQRAVAGYLDNVKRLGDATADAVSNGLSSLESDLTGFLTGGKEGFRRFVDNALQELVRLQVVKPFLASLLGATSGSGFSLSALFGLFAGARAEGGSVSAGRAYLVGEQGPEMIIPGASGTVIPNKNIRGAGGGGVSIALSPVIQIDARSDQAQIAQLVTTGMAQAQQSMWRQLRARGLA